MKPFWRSFWASSLASVIIGLLMCLVIFIIVFVVSNNLFKKEPYTIKDKSILHVELNNSISEKSFTDINSSGQNFMEESFGIREIKIGLNAAQKDPKIKGILINVGNLNIGFASLEEIRNSILAFKENSKKFVYAYSEVYDQKAYYLSSIADKVYLNPAGVVDFRGLSAEIMFFKGTIDKLNIDMEIIKGPNNDYKSAVEPFTKTQMSPESKEQTKKFLKDIWGNMLSNIHSSRGISKDSLVIFADSLSIRNAHDAENHQLVDDLIYEDQLISLLKKKTNTSESKKLNLVSFQEYCKNKTKNHPSFVEETKKDGNIAIIYAVGPIESGKGSNTNMGSATIAKAIRDAREDKDIKAIVLRVNSPGGSVLASDVIWREVSFTTDPSSENKKPLIVSMGDYAASGGYYISCPADYIFAETSTLTGSIGVFGVIPNFGPMLNDKLGITFDKVETNLHSRPLLSLNNELTEEERAIIQKEVDDIYYSFINKVALGRDGLNKEAVDQIARGRVWSGKDALNNNLVDQLGGLDEAIQYAAEKTGITKKNIQLQFFPQEKRNPLLDLVELLDQLDESNDTDSKTTIKLFSKFEAFIDIAEKIESMYPFQARLPYNIIIE